jgi:hypothetical protein
MASKNASGIRRGFSIQSAIYGNRVGDAIKTYLKFEK